ncbi:MAG TPA: Ku protein [Pseudonocardiaceae bacterium]
MRAIWKGALSFGLVSIPVRLYSAMEDKDVSFHQVHADDGARVRYRRVCTSCGEEVAYADLAKGYELPSGEMMVLTEEDLAELPLPSAKTVELLAFVPDEQIDPLALARGYYLEPDPPGRKPYELLRDALDRTKRVGLTKIAVRTKESLAVLRPRGNALVLQTMVWPDEVREAQFDVLDREVAVSDAERRMADTLIQVMAGDFEPGEYHDGYREAVLAVVEAKSAGHHVVAPPTPVPQETSVDLITALQASVEAAKAARGEPTNVPKQRKSGDARRESKGGRRS